METSDYVLRSQIAAVLADGLETSWEERAYDDESIGRVTKALENVPEGDIRQKLAIAGFTLHAYDAQDGIEQSCSTCMYYLKHRRYCELPQLDCPVEPEWSCILWRI